MLGLSSTAKEKKRNSTGKGRAVGAARSKCRDHSKKGQLRVRRCREECGGASQGGLMAGASRPRGGAGRVPLVNVGNNLKCRFKCETSCCDVILPAGYK